MAAWCSAASAADWPRFRGPEADGISRETGLSFAWNAGGPARRWRADIGRGYSVASVSRGRVYTAGHTGDGETVFCLKAENGATVWCQTFAAPVKFNREYGNFPGPRATPAVDTTDAAAPRVFMLSRHGHARCLDADTGREIWMTDLTTAVKATPPEWGFSGSPLVADGRVILNAGAAGVALDKATGRVVWETGGGAGGYATPVLFTGRGGRRAVAVFARDALAAVDAADGTRLWALPWQTKYSVNAADPIVCERGLFITSGYHRGCALVSAEDGRAVWQNKELCTQCGGGVVWKGHAFGFDGYIDVPIEKGALKCLDVATGEVKWARPGMMGGLVMADGKLVMLTTRGEIVVAAASPAAYEEIARATVLDGQCWTMPVVANGAIYCRNTEGTLVCLSAGK